VVVVVVVVEGMVGIGVVELVVGIEELHTLVVFGWGVGHNLVGTLLVVDKPAVVVVIAVVVVVVIAVVVVFVVIAVPVVVVGCNTEVEGLVRWCLNMDCQQGLVCGRSQTWNEGFWRLCLTL